MTLALVICTVIIWLDDKINVFVGLDDNIGMIAKIFSFCYHLARDNNNFIIWFDNNILSFSFSAFIVLDYNIETTDII